MSPPPPAMASIKPPMIAAINKRIYIEVVPRSIIAENNYFPQRVGS